MAKDPFSNIPELDAGDGFPPSGAPNHVLENNKLNQGKPPRNMLSSISKILMPVAIIGILVWMFAPGDHATAKKVAAQPDVVVNQATQANNTNTLLDSLKDQASKAPGPQMPAQAAAQNNPSGQSRGAAQASVNTRVSRDYAEPANMAYPLPAAFNSTSGMSPQEAAQAAALGRQQREQEIRSAPIEVSGQFKLATDVANAGQPVSQLQQLEAEIAATNSKRDNAAQAQADATLRALAGNPAPVASRAKGRNEEFLSAAAGTGPTPLLHQQSAPTHTLIQEGTAIRAVLLTGVNSDLPGKIVARVTSDVYDSIHQRFVLIPKGSKLIGVYSSEVVIGQESLLFAMTRLILPNGSYISLAGAPATNMIGQSGIKADVNNHFMKMFSTSFILGATSLMLPSSQNTVSTTSNGGGNVTTGSVAGLALNDALNTMMARNKSLSPTLSTSFGSPFMFMVAQDMAVMPYHD